MNCLLNKIKKVLFVGLGGAGQRHLRIFSQLLPPSTKFLAFRSTSHTPLLNPDFTVVKNFTIEDKFGLTLFDSLEEAFQDPPDLIVISNPTSMHLKVAQKAVENHINIFVEKPLSHSMVGVNEFKSLTLKNQVCFFIAYQRRFHPLLQKIKKLLTEEALGKIISAVFNVGSFLPSWHPYEDFRRLYAFRKEMGGGVLLTEIHEIDLCFWFFGPPEFVICAGGNYSEVSMDVEDTSHLTLGYPTFSIQVNLCFMQKHIQRDMRIIGSKGYIEWSATGNRLLWIDYINNKTHDLSDPSYTNDHMFTSQANYFLNDFKLSDSVKQLESACSSLAVVDAAKRSITHGKRVFLDSLD
ncbi:MAG: Gfo/Idh/MocA family oxidoreductase [bacterium]|nr:Gfo/Idh/MocA family oxidoreductase [bacterium]